MKNSLFPLVLRLLGNGMRFRWLRLAGKPAAPQALSIEITHQCIARCMMCNIWKIPREVPELAADEWVRLLSSDLFSQLVELDITGGEPFLRADLPDLFSAICELKTKHLKHLQSVAVTTNGILTRRVLSYTEQILRQLREKGLDLVMVCAMDAVGQVHDTVRNVENAWAKVNETIQGLRRLREEYPNLVLGLKTTILPVNIGELDGIVRYASENELFAIISPCIVTKGRYLNPDRAGDLAFSAEDRHRMLEFYERKTSGWHYHDEQLIRFLQTGAIHKTCSCGFNYLFVRSNGDLFLCPLTETSPGNVRKAPVRDLFLSQEAARMRRKIGKYPECRGCTEPGLERFSLPFEGFAYLSLLPKLGKSAFLEYHRHMGLDKYFSTGAVRERIHNCR